MIKKRFKNILKFSDNDINKFVSLLRKCVHPYEYMDDCKKFNEKTLPKDEENFISTWIWKILLMQITCKQEKFVKTFK